MARTLNIEIALSGAAFDSDPAEEVARILEDLAERIGWNRLNVAEFGLFDVNGNRCGRAFLTGQES